MISQIKGLVTAVARSSLARHASTATVADAAPSASAVIHRKFKNPFKRASSVMADVRRDSELRMKLKLQDYRAPLAPFNIGDAIQISYANEHSETKPVPVRGTVIGRRNRGIDSKFTIINALDDEWYTATYTLSSPLLRGVKIMMRNRHSQGTKRARRAKLNYLFGRDPKTFLVDQHTKELAEIQKEKEERREMQRQGKVFKKSKPLPAKAGGKGGAAKSASKAK